MRHFTIDQAPGRRYVVLEVRGSALRVVHGKPDGTTRRSEKELGGAAEARAAAEQMAGELLARGYVEQVSTPVLEQPTRTARPAATARGLVVARPVVPTRRAVAVAEVVAAPGDGLDLDTLAEAADGGRRIEATLLPRMSRVPGATPATEAPPKKKKKAGKKKFKAAKDENSLDKRVIAGIVSLVLACCGFAGRLGYDTFLRPPTIVGHWEGSRTEHEIGKFLTHTDYQLILDARHNAVMTQDRSLSEGTYLFRGDRLLLTFKDEDGEVSEVGYKVALGRATLDLFDPTTGKKVVELIRFHAKSAAVVAASSKPAEAPKDLGAAPANKAADDQLVAVAFIPKDAAFQLKRPVSWEVESGSRPDNTYSWARFTSESAKIQVFADIAGSLMAGSPQSNHEEGSELAPVHNAHELYAKKAAEEYEDYQESRPALFKGSALGEGRVATFTASTGGMFGSKVRGLRITLLTNDRRISILCEAPTSQFAKYQPTFLALARSLSR